MSLEQFRFSTPEEVEQLAAAFEVYWMVLRKQGGSECGVTTDARHALTEVRQGGGSAMLVLELPSGDVRNFRLEADTTRASTDDVADDRLVGHPEIARRAGVGTTRTVRRWITDELLHPEPGTYGRKVRSSEVDRFLADRRRSS